MKLVAMLYYDKLRHWSMSAAVPDPQSPVEEAQVSCWVWNNRHRRTEPLRQRRVHIIVWFLEERGVLMFRYKAQKTQSKFPAGVNK